MGFYRRKTSDSNILKRAHLGDVDNPNELLQLARRKGLETMPLDVEGLLKLLGVKVIKCEGMDKETSGKLVKSEEGWECYVNATHHPSRQRFTMAHELSHFVLHRNTRTEFVDSAFFRKQPSDPMEFEANEFAAKLLMPEKDFIFLYTQMEDVEVVARAFGVSPAAAKIRKRQVLP